MMRSHRSGLFYQDELKNFHISTIDIPEDFRIIYRQAIHTSYCSIVTEGMAKLTSID